MNTTLRMVIFVMTVFLSSAVVGISITEYTKHQKNKEVKYLISLLEQRPYCVDPNLLR